MLKTLQNRGEGKTGGNGVAKKEFKNLIIFLKFS